MSTYNENARPRVTSASLLKMKQNGEKIACLTAYDYTMASIVDAAGVDLILVGDSAANVMMGYDTTVPITVDEMITFAKGTVRGASRAMVVVDMPFGSYQGNPTLALANAVKIMQQTGAAALKLEGGVEIAESVKLILSAGIPVVAHLGLTPQSVNKFGGYGLRAKGEAEAQKLLDDAMLMDSLGCCAIVLEKIPATLAKKVTEAVSVPTIGIGAGHDCDGQILVVQDMLGMNRGFAPKFLRKFGNIFDEMHSALENYVSEVKSQGFPSDSEQY